MTWRMGDRQLRIGEHGERATALVGRRRVDQPAGGAAAVLVMHRDDEVVFGPSEGDVQQPGFFGTLALAFDEAMSARPALVILPSRTSGLPLLPVQPGRRVGGIAGHRARRRS